MDRQAAELKEFGKQAGQSNKEMRSQLQLQVDESNKRAMTAAEKLAAAQQRAREQAGQEIVGSYRSTAGGGAGKDALMQTTQALRARFKARGTSLQSGDVAMGRRAGLKIGG